MKPRLEGLFDRVAELHPRLCPRQVLGVRLGLHAGELLGVDVPRRDKRLLVFVETDGCFADGVSVATGCWVGRRTLRVVDLGKPAAVVADTRTGEAVRVWPDPAARARARRAAPEAPGRWHAYLSAYQALPADTLFRWNRVALSVSTTRLIGKAGERVSCERCGEAVLNQREVMVDGRPFCRSCADGAYYACLSSPEAARETAAGCAPVGYESVNPAGSRRRHPPAAGVPGRTERTNCPS